MKNILLLSIFLCSNYLLIAQSTYNEINQNSEMQNVLEFESKSASELYSFVNLWIADHYKNANEVIDADIKNTKIVVNGIAPGVVKMISANAGNQDLNYRTTFDFKDNKIRITYSNLKCPYAYSSYVYKKDGTVRTTKQATFCKESTNGYLISEIESIKESIEKSDQEEDW